MTTWRDRDIHGGLAEGGLRKYLLAGALIGLTAIDEKYPGFALATSGSPPLMSLDLSATTVAVASEEVGCSRTRGSRSS